MTKPKNDRSSRPDYPREHRVCPSCGLCILPDCDTRPGCDCPAGVQRHAKGLLLHDAEQLTYALTIAWTLLLYHLHIRRPQAGRYER